MNNCYDVLVYLVVRAKDSDDAEEIVSNMLNPLLSDELEEGTLVSWTTGNLTEELEQRTPEPESIEGDVTYYG